MTPAQLLAATAADMRKVAEAATDGPWFFNGYCGVYSKPLSDAYDPWMEPLVDAGHELRRRGDCRACESTNGCEHAEADYTRDPAVAWVPPHHGDTAVGRRAADAVHIAAWSPTIVRVIADWLDAEADSYGWYRPADQREIVEAGPCGLQKLAICEAWWKSRGMEPKELDHA